MALHRCYFIPVTTFFIALAVQPALAQQPERHGARRVPMVVQDVKAMALPGELLESKKEKSQPGDIQLPASMTQPSGLLTLAPAGIQPLPALPTTGHGCRLHPTVRCTGPEYCGGAPRLYYKTHPRDDDPILPLATPTHDRVTKHWYETALKMILRKKTVTEAIK